jgi:hypothetical protein
MAHDPAWTVAEGAETDLVRSSFISWAANTRKGLPYGLMDADAARCGCSRKMARGGELSCVIAAEPVILGRPPSRAMAVGVCAPPHALSD